MDLVIGFEAERSRNAALITGVEEEDSCSFAINVAGIETGMVERAVSEWLSSSYAYDGAEERKRAMLVVYELCMNARYAKV